MSLSAMGSRYGRAKVKQEGGDTEMEDLTLVIMPISINLLAFYHEWRFLIVYATHYLFKR